MPPSPSPRRLRLSAFVPRYSLRTLLVAMFVIGALIEAGLLAWPRFVRFLEGREYSALRKTKEPFVLQQRARREPDYRSASVDDARPVPDDFVILVRRGNSLGCFIPRKQNQKGESLECDWYYRTDGQGTLSPTDRQVYSGHSVPGPYVSGQGLVHVKFGPFDFEWSGSGPGWGYVYYEDRSPSESVAADHPRICTTNCKTVELLDARAAEWLYKAYDGDPGLPGNVDCLTPVSRRAPQRPAGKPAQKSPIDSPF